MEMVEGIRCMSTYPYPDSECIPDCKEKGNSNTTVESVNILCMHATI